MTLRYGGIGGDVRNVLVDIKDEAGADFPLLGSELKKTDIYPQLIVVLTRGYRF